MRPKVFVLTKLFWPEGGGAELATYLIVKEVLSKSFDVVIASGTRRPKSDVLRAVDYVHWSALESKYKPVEWLRLLANTRWFTKLVERADVVYIPSHTLIPMAMAAKLVKPNVKVALHLHNYQALAYTSIVLAGREPNVTTDAIVEYREHRSLLRALLAGLGHYANHINRLAVMFADKIICVSQRQYEILLKYLPELREKAVVVYNPPPPLPIIDKKVSREPILIYPGGGSYVKGFHMAIGALVRVLKRHNCKAYVISGREVPSRESLRLRSLRKRLGDKLTILSKMPHEEYLKLHESAWGLLFPSVCEEPLPYTVVESMLMGTMPVAARVGGVPEIVEGSPAEEYLFTSGDVDELADKIEVLLSLSKESIVNVGMKLRGHVLRSFDEEKIEDKIADLFSSLMN
jgi:glycosyltransferase involved in cell wall biosynthesis